VPFAHFRITPESRHRLFMMGWTPRPTASMCQSGGVEYHLREASVSEVITIGLDIAKHVFTFTERIGYSLN